MNSFPFSIINTLKAPISPSNLSGGAEAGRNDGTPVKETSPHAELLTNASPDWLKTLLQAEGGRKIKAKKKKMFHPVF